MEVVVLVAEVQEFGLEADRGTAIEPHAGLKAEAAPRVVVDQTAAGKHNGAGLIERSGMCVVDRTLGH